MTDPKLRFLVRPGGTIKQVWLLVCMAGLLYYLISVPFEIAFARHYKRQTFIIDLLLMCFYSADIALNLTLFAVKKQGKVITDVAQFRAIYRSQYFYGDVVGLAPVSILMVLSQGGGYSSWFLKDNYRPIVNGLRLIQVLRVNQANLYFSSLVETIEDVFGINMSGDTTYLVLLFSIVLLMCHWLACLLYYVGRWELWYARAKSKSSFWNSGGSGEHGEATRQAWKWYKDDAWGCEKYRGRRRNLRLGATTPVWADSCGVGRRAAPSFQTLEKRTQTHAISNVSQVPRKEGFDSRRRVQHLALRAVHAGPRVHHRVAGRARPVAHGVLLGHVPTPASKTLIRSRSRRRRGRGLVAATPRRRRKTHQERVAATPRPRRGSVRGPVAATPR